MAWCSGFPAAPDERVQEQLSIPGWKRQQAQVGVDLAESGHSAFGTEVMESCHRLGPDPAVGMLGAAAWGSNQ